MTDHSCEAHSGDCSSGHADGGSHVSTRSSVSATTGMIVPDWYRARETTSGRRTTIEIPLTGYSNRLARLTMAGSTAERSQSSSRVIMKLVVQHDNAYLTTRMFIVTMIEFEPSNVEYNYLQDFRFTGVVITSDLDGYYTYSALVREGIHTQIHLGLRSENSVPRVPKQGVDGFLGLSFQHTITKDGPANGSIWSCLRCYQRLTNNVFCDACRTYFHQCPFYPTLWSHYVTTGFCDGCKAYVYVTGTILPEIEIKVCRICGASAEKGCRCCKVCNQKECVCYCGNCNKGPCECQRCSHCKNPDCGGCFPPPAGPGSGSIEMLKVTYRARITDVISKLRPEDKPQWTYEVVLEDMIYPPAMPGQSAKPPKPVLYMAVVPVDQGRYRLYINHLNVDKLGEFAKTLMMTHELFHMRLFYNGVSSDGTNLQHEMMATEPEYRRWLGDVFPGRQAEYNNNFYFFCKHAGTGIIPPAYWAEYNQFCNDYGLPSDF